MKMGRWLLLVLALVVFASGVSAQKWRFVVAGDGRSNPRANPPRPEDKNGINRVITSEIAKAVIAEKAKFLMFTGDLVLGAKTAGEFRTQLLAWRAIMQPVYARKIPIYAVRGNHESGSGDATGVWNQVFSGPYAMPQNGPSTEKNITFTATYQNVRIIGLDQFTAGPIAVDQPWLDSVLSKNTSPHIFTMGHEMAFMAGNHTDCLDADVARRDTFWNSLMAAGERCYFAGHDHFYDHLKVIPPTGPVIHQYVAGTAGAPFYDDKGYKGNNGDWNVVRVKHIDKTYGYLVVEIDGKKATVTFKGRKAPGVYVPMDTYSYVVN